LYQLLEYIKFLAICRQSW